MKHNIISRIFALITLMALLSIGVQAFSDSAYLQRGEVIGTPADEGGILLPDPPSLKTSISSSTELFKMTATSISAGKLLTTHGVAGKSFTRSNLDNYFYFSGTLSNSDPNNLVVRAGACYYDPLTTTYNAVVAACFDSGVASTSIHYNSIYYFSTQIDYYGFIKNEYTTGIVSGNLTFYTDAT